MKRNVWFSAVFALIAVSAMGQERSSWRTAGDIREGTRGTIIVTVVDVDEARRQLQVVADEDRYQQITVVTDAVSTQYNGFGGVINDAPEIFVGSTGFANVRVGDRIEIRGTGRSNARIAAEALTLRGRATEVPQTGVGQTRPPTSVSTPTATSTADVSGGYAAGTIRTINVNEGRIVIETSGPYRRMITIRASRGTPVYYRGEIYRIENLEVGDEIRAEADPRTAAADEISARVIDVTRSVQERGTSATTDRRITTLSGRVTRVDRASNLIWLETGREVIRIDVSRVVDESGRSMQSAIRVGDDIDVTGSFDGTSTTFVASTVRTEGGRDIVVRDDDEVDEDELGDFVTVTISGTVTESLQTSPTLVVRDRATNRVMYFFVTNDFIYRTRAGTYATADRLAVGDAVLIKAYRDEDGNHIAQTIRIR